MKKLVTTSILTLFLSSCLSFQLPGGKVITAKDIVYKDPSKPYKSIKNPTSDKAWMSEKTGNTISFLSECGGRNDLTLEQMENESLSSIKNAEIVSTEEINFDARAARKTVARGTVDGVAVKLALLVYTKNGCNFTISYGGVERKFDKERSSFDEFLHNFRTP
jgi:hypothetical protein